MQVDPEHEGEARETLKTHVNKTVFDGQAYLLGPLCMKAKDKQRDASKAYPNVRLVT